MFRKITCFIRVAALLAAPFLACAQGVITTVAGSTWVFPEIEVLAARDENGPSQVLAALLPGPTVRGTGRPLIVIAEGRTWSQTAGDSRLLAQLRSASPPQDLGLFGATVVRQLLEQPIDGAYSFSAAAHTEVYKHTAGFPLLVAAVAYAIFEQRATVSIAGSVSPEEVRDSLALALKVATASLAWARDQVTTEQQMLLCALAQIAIRSDREDRFVTFDEMLDVIEGDSHYRFKKLPDVAFLQPLVENFIVQSNADQSAFRIRAPLFQAWVGQDSFEAVQFRATKKNPEATVRLEQALALQAQEELSAARQAFLQAAIMNPHLWRAALGVAGIDAQLGQLDEALARVRTLARERPGNMDVERSLVELLTVKAEVSKCWGPAWKRARVERDSKLRPNSAPVSKGQTPPPRTQN